MKSGLLPRIYLNVPVVWNYSSDILTNIESYCPAIFSQIIRLWVKICSDQCSPTVLSEYQLFLKRWRLRPELELSCNICSTWVMTFLWRPAWRWLTCRARPLSGPSLCWATGWKLATVCPAESVSQSETPWLFVLCTLCVTPVCCVSHWQEIQFKVFSSDSNSLRVFFFSPLQLRHQSSHPGLT